MIGESKGRLLKEEFDWKHNTKWLWQNKNEGSQNNSDQLPYTLCDVTRGMWTFSLNLGKKEQNK